VPAGATYLARSPGGTATWDNIAFINCKMDAHVATAGWAGWRQRPAGAESGNVPNAASGWREYGSTTLAGTPLDLRRARGRLSS
jgi:pectate lyase